MKRIGFRSLVVKQFIFSSLLFSLIFVIFFISRLNETERLSREILSRDTEISAVQLEKYFDEFYRGILNILFILENQDGFLSEANREEAHQMLRDIVDSNSKTIKMVYLITKEGPIIAGKQGLYDALGHEQIEQIRNTDFNSYQSLVVSEPYFTPLSGYTLAFIYPVKDKSGQVAGLTMVELNLYELGEYITATSGNNRTSTVILDRNGISLSFNTYNTLSPPARDIYPFVIEEDLAILLGDQKSGESQFTYGGKRFILYKSLLESFQWQLCILLDREKYEEGVNTTLRNMLVLGALMLLILFLGSSLLSLYFAQPIHNLAQLMNRSNEDLPPTLPDLNRKDEIGSLYESYNGLIKRIEKLLNEVKQGEEEKRYYEIGMLQNQITPHFLLNTLACIRSLARLGKSNDVSRTIKNLINLLSYRLENQGYEVKLLDEIGSVKAYLEIQKIRFPHLYVPEIILPPELEEVRVIPLILQPIVENALFKGLLPKGERGNLRIHCHIKNNILLIYVRDNGVGMDAVKRDGLLSERKKYHDTTNPDNSHGHSIGVINVQQRIRLQYGKKFGLTIYSQPSLGTVVRFTLPLLQKE